MHKAKGVLVILSGPSGSGKDTVISELKKRNVDIRQSISATTRPPREGEKDGVDYYFIDVPTFEQRIREGYFLEYVRYGSNYYGTPREAVEQLVNDGISVLLKIEVEGAGNIRRVFPDVVSVFLIPPSLDVLEKRLRGRGTETEESFCSRFAIARNELSRAPEYDYVVINDDLDDCVNQVCSILDAEKFRYSCMKPIVDEILTQTTIE